MVLLWRWEEIWSNKFEKQKTLFSSSWRFTVFSSISNTVRNPSIQKSFKIFHLASQAYWTWGHLLIFYTAVGLPLLLECQTNSFHPSFGENSPLPQIRMCNIFLSRIREYFRSGHICPYHIFFVRFFSPSNSLKMKKKRKNILCSMVCVLEGHSCPQMSQIHMGII